MSSNNHTTNGQAVNVGDELAQSGSNTVSLDAILQKASRLTALAGHAQTQFAIDRRECEAMALDAFIQKQPDGGEQRLVATVRARIASQTRGWHQQAAAALEDAKLCIEMLEKQRAEASADRKRFFQFRQQADPNGGPPWNWLHIAYVPVLLLVGGIMIYSGYGLVTSFMAQHLTDQGKLADNIGLVGLVVVVSPIILGMTPFLFTTPRMRQRYVVALLIAFAVCTALWITTYTLEVTSVTPDSGGWDLGTGNTDSEGNSELVWRRARMLIQLFWDVLGAMLAKLLVAMLSLHHASVSAVETRAWKAASRRIEKIDAPRSALIDARNELAAKASSHHSGVRAAIEQGITTYRAEYARLEVRREALNGPEFRPQQRVIEPQFDSDQVSRPNGQHNSTS